MKFIQQSVELGKALPQMLGDTRTQLKKKKKSEIFNHMQD